ncbi:alanine--tRNA ligase, partial [bacterium]|nr:alanine--tRNA ligase [bacterium]
MDRVSAALPCLRPNIEHHLDPHPVMRSSNQIRSEFLDFFRSKGHAIVPSDSVVPADDPTLLFTNAGMNQFKKIFLGLETRAYTRAADSQKVLRVSGKHNDLEEVGRDHTHHTFFEMLGNWSFGDYYKREAIAWAWELLTGVWRLPPDKLYATVFETDDESLQIWRTQTGIDHSHISRHGARDNFWEMGETGPCGPCSEIHMDMGPGTCAHEGKGGHACGVNVDGCGRFVEIWNLVFIQYDRQKDEVLKELPSRHVDTGMGFERLVRVLQGAASNYDTDLFRPLIERVEQLSGKTYSPGPEGTSFRVVADHVRALAFTVGDGVVPSNEGRGYVIRRILRRAARHGRLLGLKAPFLHELAGRVVDLMGGAYPDLTARREHIASVIRGEEERFGETLDQGLSLFDEIAQKLRKTQGAVIAGSEAFKLYDTYGFPLDLTQVMAEESGFTVDVEGFDAAMREQRERARAARGEVTFQASKDVDYPACVFVGYQSLSRETTVTGIYRKQLALAEAQRGERVDVTLADTPFYGESGGQAGDVGTIESPRGTPRVLATVKAFNQSTVHGCEVVSGAVAVGGEVT